MCQHGGSCCDCERYDATTECVTTFARSAATTFESRPTAAQNVEQFQKPPHHPDHHRDEGKILAKTRNLRRGLRRRMSCREPENFIWAMICAAAQMVCSSGMEQQSSGNFESQNGPWVAGEACATFCCTAARSAPPRHACRGRLPPLKSPARFLPMRTTPRILLPCYAPAGPPHALDLNALANKHLNYKATFNKTVEKT